MEWLSKHKGIRESAEIIHQRSPLYYKNNVKCENHFCFSDTRLFVTIAVDLVVTGVTEPVRFIVETKAKVYPSGEKFFWSPSKPKFHETYIMELKEVHTVREELPQQL